MTALAELQRVGRGRYEEKLLFAHPSGEGWKQAWVWSVHVRPRLEQLQREGLGGLPGGGSGRAERDAAVAV